MTHKSTTTSILTIILAAVVLSACGIAEDRVPRDIDPQKQEELNNP
jgi:hypothetical protein